MKEWNSMKQLFAEVNGVIHREWMEWVIAFAISSHSIHFNSFYLFLLRSSFIHFFRERSEEGERN